MAERSRVVNPVVRSIDVSNVALNETEQPDDKQHQPDPEDMGRPSEKSRHRVPWTRRSGGPGHPESIQHAKIYSRKHQGASRGPNDLLEPRATHSSRQRSRPTTSPVSSRARWDSKKACSLTVTACASGWLRARAQSSRITRIYAVEMGLRTAQDARITP